jgi:hypothetical protein
MKKSALSSLPRRCGLGLVFAMIGDSSIVRFGKPRPRQWHERVMVERADGESTLTAGRPVGKALPAL